MILSKNKISDSQSSDISTDGLVHRTRSSSLFPIPKLFIGLSTKGLSDLDPTRSPTSPLDFKSPRSPKCFDYNNSAGLGLVNHLTDESPSAKKVVSSPLRLSNTRSLPIDYGLFCQVGKKTEIKPKTHDLVREEFGKTRSCSADLIKLGLKLNDDSLCKSLPISIIGSLSASEIEQSEDYTCIISYGPNAKTTHIFGDCILESHSIKSPNDFHNKDVKNRSCSETDFLSFCFSCKKKLDGKDIYIYRGEKAFCSCDCRDNEISIEEEREKASSRSPSSEFDDTEDIFMAGMVVAT